MSNDPALARLPDGWRPVAALIDADGTRTTPAFRRLSGPRVSSHDLADAVHCLCLLHGHRPGMVETAAAHAADPGAREWLGGCADGFGHEREWLARLIAAAGPVPSTVGQTMAETAIQHQRHALETLAASERRGCAVGAVAALLLDWGDVRTLLDRIGERFGLEPPPARLPAGGAPRDRAEAASFAPDGTRAQVFGAQQLLAQHRALWDLVDARAAARA